MAQSSGPISQGSDSERQFTDVMWRDRFGDEPGVIGDLDGSAYRVTLSTNSDVVQIGSSTQVSTATVAGFVHRIPEDQPEGITIPAATGSARTDIIALRYDPAFTGLPGPVRLTRIPGTATGLPGYDSAPPGIEDLPLWSITRQPGQALSQALVRRLFPRLAPSLEIDPGAPLPASSPLGTTLRQGSRKYVRALGTAGVPEWRPDGGQLPSIELCTMAAGWSAASGQAPGAYVDSSGLVHLVGVAVNGAGYNPNDGSTTRTVLTLPTSMWPEIPVPVLMHTSPAGRGRIVMGDIGTDGVLRLTGGTEEIGLRFGHFLNVITPFHPGYSGGAYS